MSISPRSALHENLSDQIKATRPPNSGVVGFISWSRLAETLRKSREVSPRETIEWFVIEDGGLRIYYGDRETHREALGCRHE
jgi:hypothetical protein